MAVITLLAKRIDNKVRPTPKSSIQQHLISGSLSYVVIFVPLLVILYIALSLVEYGVFFECVILFFAASFQPQKRTFIKVQQALNNEKKLLARQWLSSIVKRDTEVLSPIGIGKAAIEALILRYVYQILTPILVYLAFGVVMALAYRIALECYWQWKQPRNPDDSFSKPMALVCRIFQFIPMLITLLLCFLFIVKRTKVSRENVTTSKPKLTLKTLSPLLFHTVGKRLGFTLGGPVQYSGIRKKLPRYGSPTQVKMSDMLVTVYTLNTITLVVSGFLLILTTVLIVA
ncbi:cobalamin biosynthesis protein [Alteromonas sp. 5E99-2]|uniref:cobalamin biosynthesis protein n=1 Tax=Alteromonas sp. 5E99-2 TaxID=2817683 RepID=UPI00325AD102